MRTPTPPHHPAIRPPPHTHRCSLLCKAALEAVWHVPCGGIPYGDANTVYIANDWHTALLPVYLQVCVCVYVCVCVCVGGPGWGGGGAGARSG